MFRVMWGAQMLKGIKLKTIEYKPSMLVVTEVVFRPGLAEWWDAIGYIYCEVGR